MATSSGGDPLLGRRIDDFEIVKRLGAGGMGVVYEAKQHHPPRRAAVKVLRPALVTPAMLRRFEYEAELLARLQHPGIAHVYGAGTFDLGDGIQSWFAMELIEGEPMHVYARQHRLSIAEKIRLLLRICDAVQHAHQRGVIHRDLKPANILVTPTAEPKILDFGVARAVDADVQATLHLALGELVGTLNYMSPEQLAGNPNEGPHSRHSANGDPIDARSDVYALGVIGYELLAGRLPHDRRSGTLTDIIRSVERDEPPRLGTIDPVLRGDVEIIFVKALEKDRERRYQSAADLAADLKRHLNHEPILARPATALYQFRKYARRNRALVGGVAATILALLIGLLLYAQEARQARVEAARARYEADKATAINNYIVNDFLMKLLAAANEPAAAGTSGDTVAGRLPAIGLIDRAAANIGAMFADDPLAEAAVRNEIASIYYNLGAFDKAAELFHLSLERWEVRLGPDHADTLKAVNNLGQSLANLGRTDEAEALYRRALDGRLRALGEDDLHTLASMNNLAILLQRTGRLDEAEALMRRALAGQRRVHGPTHKHTLITMINLGTLQARRGNLDEAEKLHRHVHEASAATLGADHVTTMAAGVRLGNTLRSAGRTDEAAAVLANALAGLERALGPAHLDTVMARRSLARVYGDQGRMDEAVAELRLALDAANTQPALAETARGIEAELRDLIHEEE